MLSIQSGEGLAELWVQAGHRGIDLELDDGDGGSADEFDLGDERLGRKDMLQVLQSSVQLEVIWYILEVA